MAEYSQHGRSCESERGRVQSTWQVMSERAWPSTVNMAGHVRASVAGHADKELKQYRREIHPLSYLFSILAEQRWIDYLGCGW